MTNTARRPKLNLPMGMNADVEFFFRFVSEERFNDEMVQDPGGRTSLYCLTNAVVHPFLHFIQGSIYLVNN